MVDIVIESIASKDNNEKIAYTLIGFKYDIDIFSIKEKTIISYYYLFNLKIQK